MAIVTTMLQHTIYRQSGLVWVNDMDLICIIIVVPFGSYNTVQFIDHYLVQ